MDRAHTQLNRAVFRIQPPRVGPAVRVAYSLGLRALGRNHEECPAERANLNNDSHRYNDLEVVVTLAVVNNSRLLLNFLFTTKYD